MPQYCHASTNLDHHHLAIRISRFCFRLKMHQVIARANHDRGPERYDNQLNTLHQQERLFAAGSAVEGVGGSDEPQLPEIEEDHRVEGSYGERCRCDIRQGWGGQNDVDCGAWRRVGAGRKVGLPRFRERSGLGIRVSGLTAFCPPLWGNLLVRPRASFRPGLHDAEAVVSSGCQGRPARWRCNLL